MDKYSYTIIIPHKNSPKLLNRCLDSIPQREDIEIIIVDDNSDADKHPHIKRQNVKVVQLSEKESNFAGHARNVGMKYATGKWILFADADDYYSEGFLRVLDEYNESDFDVIYFNYRHVKDAAGSGIDDAKNQYDTYLRNGDFDKIKYYVHSPWNKMVRKAFIDKYDIAFEESKRGNDTFFSYQVGFLSEKAHYLEDKLYNYTYSSDGISHHTGDTKKLTLQLRNLVKTNAFYRYIGHSDWHDSYLRWIRLYAQKNSFSTLVMSLWEVFKNLGFIMRDPDKYAKILTSKSTKK